MARPVNLKALRLVKFSVSHHHVYAYNQKSGMWESIACWKLPPYMYDQIPLPEYPKETPPGRILNEARLSLDEIRQLEDESCGSNPANSYDEIEEMKKEA